MLGNFRQDLADVVQILVNFGEVVVQLLTKSNQKWPNAVKL